MPIKISTSVGTNQEAVSKPLLGLFLSLVVCTSDAINALRYPVSFWIQLQPSFRFKRLQPSFLNLDQLSFVFSFKEQRHGSYLYVETVGVLLPLVKSRFFLSDVIYVTVPINLILTRAGI